MLVIIGRGEETIGFPLQWQGRDLGEGCVSQEEASWCSEVKA